MIESQCTITDSNAYTSKFIPKYYLATHDNFIETTTNEIGHSDFIHQDVVECAVDPDNNPLDPCGKITWKKQDSALTYYLFVLTEPDSATFSS